MTKTEKIIDFVLDQISKKIWIDGSRLPSVRQLAHQMNCSVSTVVEAYARLVAEGVLESRVGSGYYVLAPRVHYHIIEQELSYHREVDPLWISKQSLEAKSNILKPGCGWLPEGWMPEQTIRKALKLAAKSDTALLMNYALPHGHLALRQYIARKKEIYDLHLHPNQILLTESATNSIDLIFRHILQAGDIILVDDPCYFNFSALIKTHQLKAIAIPYTKHGPDIEKFAQALVFKPKLYLTNAGIHNPTGAVLSLQTAYQIAKLAEKNNLLIVEDDIFSEFEYTPAPRYASLSGFDHVIQIGSFTKTLSAAIRCGYIISNLDLIDQLIDLRISTNFSANNLNAEIIYQALMDPSYPKYVEWLKKQLNKTTKDTIQKLAILGIQPWIIPKAGIFIWCKLPDRIEASKLSQLCLQKNVILAPSKAFSQSQSTDEYMRFNVAHCIDKKVFDILGDAIQALK